MPDVLFLGQNEVGEQVYDWLTEDATETTVLALLTEAEQLSLVHELKPDLLVSAGFRHIVPESVLEVPKQGAVNLHLSYLPHNRGMNPNVWSILDDAPPGVTVHYMTPKVDAGPIIDRQRVDVTPADTGRDLYYRLVDAQVDQFKQVWPEIVSGDVETVSQDNSAGSYHSKEEFVDLWELNRDETVRVGDFLDRLRALTFPPFNNAYFEVNDERYYVEIEITPESESDPAGSLGTIPQYDE